MILLNGPSATPWEKMPMCHFHSFPFCVVRSSKLWCSSVAGDASADMMIPIRLQKNLIKNVINSEDDDEKTL